MSQVRKEGFWRDPDSVAADYQRNKGLPMFVAKEPWSRAPEFVNKLRQVEAKAQVIHYRGFSRCRACGQPNGSTEFTYRGWCWPEGYGHYIEQHGHGPSMEFLKFVVSQVASEQAARRN